MTEPGERPESGAGVPLCELTHVELSEQSVNRMWANIERHSVGPASARRGSPFQWRLGVWGVVVLVLGLAVSGVWLSGAGRGAASQGPLLTNTGERFQRLESQAAGSAERVSFADGSSIEAAPGASVEGLASTEREFVVLLTRGRAHFSITPGGPRRWSIETAGARVEVVGTVLSVEKTANFVIVHVESGAVLIRSSALQEGVRRLEAGHSLSLPLEEARAASVPDPAAASAEVELEATQPVEMAKPAEAAIEVAEPEKPRVRRGLGQEVPAAELWTRIDAARQAGEVAEAAQLLERLISDYPGDSRVALAAFTLGVLEFERRNRPEAAVRRFRQALDLGIAPSLREGCYLRLARAVHQLGDDRQLERVVSEYSELYPAGRHRTTLSRLITNAAGSDPNRSPVSREIAP
jgi:transmembrane sensor